MRPIREIRCEADLDAAVRRCERRWRAWQQGLRESEIAALLELRLDQAEARLCALPPRENGEGAA
ncbi:hypothetical protein [Inquilinus limosus]|uniref:Uncharacterized protein n=1 Tax=Inquilinus limosus MP06 TaxID=1398085 RepID=A0A0A0DEI8_9PROT|nr:hypothetical protein [Inquilinus limosus]KGM35377.1 hypothetical protein P409_04795 [Inquilinus limosus MP06]